MPQYPAGNMGAFAGEYGGLVKEYVDRQFDDYKRERVTVSYGYVVRYDEEHRMLIVRPELTAGASDNIKVRMTRGEWKKTFNVQVWDKEAQKTRIEKWQTTGARIRLLNDPRSDMLTFQDFTVDIPAEKNK